MPEKTEKIVKQITIGTETRDIGAKYDANGSAIDTTYQTIKLQTPLTGLEGVPKKDTVEDAIQGLKTAINTTRADIAENYVDTEGLTDAVQGAINTLVSNNQLTVKVFENRKISLKTELQSLVLPATTGYNKHIKVIIFNSSISDSTLKGEVEIDSIKLSSLDVQYLMNGAVYEIYQNVLLAVNSLGNTQTAISNQTQWTHFAITPDPNKIGDSTFSALIFEEGWADKPNTQGGTQ